VVICEAVLADMPPKRIGSPSIGEFAHSWESSTQHTGYSQATFSLVWAFFVLDIRHHDTIRSTLHVSPMLLIEQPCIVGSESVTIDAWWCISHHDAAPP